MLNPLLLWFLPLALVPIILHLITLYRVKTVELSTFRFLMDSYVQKRQRVKLLEYILMLLRTLFVALIIFALSRPVIQEFGWMGSESGKDVTIIIDDSIAMNLRTDATTTLDRAKSAAESIVGLLKADDQITLISAGAKPVVLSHSFASEARNIKDKIQSIAPSATGSSIAGALETVMNTPPRGPRVVYVLSDLNRHAWSELQGHPVTKRLIAEHDTRVVVMNLAPSKPPKNLAVVGESPPAIHSIAGLPLRLTATVLNTTPDQAADAVLSVSLDDQQIQRIPYSLRSGQKVSESLIITPSHPGIIHGKYQLPADAFPTDDQLNFVLNIDPKINVLLLTPPPIPQPDGPPENADTFVKAALAAPLSVDMGKTTDATAIAAALQVTSIPWQSATEPLLTNADVVVLLNVPMNQDLGTKLRKYASAGGGLIVFPGENIIPGDYRTYLFAKSTSLPNVAAPLAFESPQGDINDEANFQAVAGLDLKHPIMAAFSGDRTDYFSTSRIYRYFPLNLAPTAADADPLANNVLSGGGAKPPAAAQATDASENAARPRVIMRLFDRRPLLVETRLGDGKVIVSGFSATPRWSSLPLKPEFVPLVLRAVAHARRPAPAECDADVAPGQPASLRLADRWPQARVEVVDPLGHVSPVELFRSGKTMVGGTTETNTIGVYTFRIFPRTNGAPDSLEVGFCVNPQISQADFTPIADADLKQTFAPMEIQYLRGSTDDPLLREQLTKKNELWRTLIWVMFAVIGIEFVLSTLGAGIPEATNLAQPRLPWYRRAGEILTGAR